MGIQQTTIFSDNLVSATENLSNKFTEGFGFYLIAPASSFEYQIDALINANSSGQEGLETILNLILAAVGTPVPVLATADQQDFFFFQ